LNLFRNLVRYAHEHRDQVPPPCYRDRRIDWVLDLNADPAGRHAATITRPGQRMWAPQIHRTAGTAPILCVDNASYVIGTPGGTITPAKARTRAEAFWAQMRSLLRGPDTHPAITAAFLVADGVGNEIDAPAGLGPKDTIGIRVNGVWLHELQEVAARWVDIVAHAKGAADGVCVACGTVARLAKTLPNSIPPRLLPGAEHHAQLAVLTLHERTRPDAHLPVCVPCGDLAASALETLLADRDHARRLPGQDTVTVAWGSGHPDADRQVRELLASL